MKLVVLTFLSLSQLVSCSRNASAPAAPNNSSSTAKNASAPAAPNNISSTAKNSSTPENKEPAKKEPAKKDASADLNALDAAMSALPTEPAKPVPKVEAKKESKKASPKAHAHHKAAPKKSAQELNALNAPSKEDVKRSDFAKKEQHFAVKEDADEVLEAGDALAKKAEDEKHRKENEKVATAKVVHVDTPPTKPDEEEGVDAAKSLASDLEGLKDRAAEQKEQKVEDQKQEEKRKLRAQKVKAIKDQRAKNGKAPKNDKKQRAMNLDRLVKLTNEIKKTAFVQKEKPVGVPKTDVEAHSTLEAHADKLNEAQKEVDEMKANAKAGKTTPVVKEKEEKAPEVKAPEPQEAPEPSKQVPAATKVASVSHHPENAEHLKNIEQAVGHLADATGEPPAAVKEVQEVLQKAQAMTGKAAPIPQFTADPHPSKLRAKKFKNKMESHVDAMQEALHEHQKEVDTKIHLEKVRKLREAEEAAQKKWEEEQARLQQLKVAAENLAREKRQKEDMQALENRTASEAAHRVDDPQAEFHARENQMRKPQKQIPKSAASALQLFGLVFPIAAFLA